MLCVHASLRPQTRPEYAAYIWFFIWLLLYAGRCRCQTKGKKQDERNNYRHYVIPIVNIPKGIRTAWRARSLKLMAS